MSTTIPVSAGDSEDVYVVMQLKKELGSLKKEVEAMKLFLTKEMDSLKSDYKRDIEILRQDLNVKRTEVSGLKIQFEHLSKTKGSQ